MARARSQLDDSLHGAAPAPYRALDLIEGAAGMDDRGGLPGRGGSARRPALHAAGESIALRVRPRRAARPPRSRPPVRRAARGGEGRDRRRRAHGRAARDALPAQASHSHRPARRRPGDRRPRARDDSRRARRRRGSGPARPRAGALARRPGVRHDGLRRVRAVRLRDRGRLRGARREATGLRRARGSGLGRVPARDEHVCSLGNRDGRGPRASRAARRDALLQPGRPDAARRDRPHARDRRHRTRDCLGRRGQAPQARRCSSTTLRGSSSTGC